MDTRQEADTQANAPALRAASSPGDGQAVALTGDWTTLGLARRALRLERELMGHAARPLVAWDLSRVEMLDGTGALLLWRAWGRALPERLVIPAVLKEYFIRLPSGVVEEAQRLSLRRELAQPVVRSPPRAKGPARTARSRGGAKAQRRTRR